MTKLPCVLIAGNRQVDDIMHNMDVFEPFKAIASVKEVVLTLKPGCTPEKAMKDLLVLAEEMELRVVAAFIPGSPVGAYLDETVKVISTGQKWCMLDKVLQTYNFVKTPEIHDAAHV